MYIYIYIDMIYVYMNLWSHQAGPRGWSPTSAGPPHGGLVGIAWPGLAWLAFKRSLKSLNVPYSTLHGKHGKARR